jgi:hypothetical protein
MPRSHDFEAELHHWTVVMHPTPLLTYPTIVGTVRNDKRGRFANRRTIRTSVVLTPVEDIRPGAIIRTLNTRYLLVGPAAQKN